MYDKKQLLGAAGSTTSGTNTVIDGGLYVLDYVCSSWGTGALQLQALGPDNATFINVGTSVTANGSQGPIALGFPTTVKATITGTPSANVFASLTRYQGPI
jgi:hypothetical protein